jgi:outer membrane protein TolC
LFVAAAVTAAGAQVGAADLSALTVQEAVAVALQANRDILQAREEVRRADYRITEARSAAFPQVNGAWSLERVLKPNVFVMSFPDSTGAMRKNRLKMGTDYNSSLGANLTQPLYVGGKVGTALKAARVYRILAAESERLVRQNVVLGAMQAFNAALLARELEGIARASLTQAEKHLANVEVLRQAGTATDYDRLRARVNATNLRPRLIEAENNTRTALLRLKEVMGVDPAAALGITGAFVVPDTAVLARATSEVALSQRPDVAIGRLTVDLQGKAVRIARGDFLPTLSATSTLAYNGNFDKLGYNDDDWSTYWTAGLNLSFPLFTGFRSSAKYQQAKVDQRQAQTGLLKLQDAVTIEVQQGAMNLRQALAQIASGSLNVDEAARAVEIAENLYANGKATQLEALDAQLALQVARTNMASALYAGTMAEIALNKSLGLLEAPDGRGENGKEQP